MFSSQILNEVSLIHQLLRARKMMAAFAESCTGGLIAGAFTEPAGASDVFDRGFVTYSNAAKTDLLAVPPALIGRCGAVSREVAAAMAEGALSASRAQIAMSVTGIAGPGGGSAEKPVGLVFMACARSNAATVVEEHRYGDLGREDIRRAALASALALLKRALQAEGEAA